MPGQSIIGDAELVHSYFGEHEYSTETFKETTLAEVARLVNSTTIDYTTNVYIVEASVYSKGYEYAYMYPGFTKVIQAVGRVIRTETDRGFAILVDERFNYSQYRNLMPQHWNKIKVINSSYVLKKELEEFNNK
jgi:hypothetical protein